MRGGVTQNLEEGGITPSRNQRREVIPRFCKTEAGNQAQGKHIMRLTRNSFEGLKTTGDEFGREGPRGFNFIRNGRRAMATSEYVSSVLLYFNSREDKEVRDRREQGKKIKRRALLREQGRVGVRETTNLNRFATKSQESEIDTRRIGWKSATNNARKSKKRTRERGGSKRGKIHRVRLPVLRKRS